jgi:hypothetical protein
VGAVDAREIAVRDVADATLDVVNLILFKLIGKTCVIHTLANGDHGDGAMRHRERLKQIPT